jgi:hypothetical protein
MEENDLTGILVNYIDTIKNNNTVYKNVIDEINRNKFNTRYFSDIDKNLIKQTVDSVNSKPLLFGHEESEHIELSKDNLIERMAYNEKHLQSQDTVTLHFTEYKDEMKDKLENSKAHVGSQYRSVEINNYYNKKYKAQNKILRLIIKVALVVIILSFINSLIDNIYVNTIYLAIIGVIFGYAFIHITYQLFDIFLRDKHIFDEYDIVKVRDHSSDYVTENAKSKCNIEN